MNNTYLQTCLVNNIIYDDYFNFYDSHLQFMFRQNLSISAKNRTKLCSLHEVNI